MNNIEKYLHQSFRRNGFSFSEAKQRTEEVLKRTIQRMAKLDTAEFNFAWKTERQLIVYRNGEKYQEINISEEIEEKTK